MSRVYDKWLLWIKYYPTFKKLRQASLSDVLKLWQGLGYQRRAKALLTISQQCDTLPESYEELVGLSDIGDYTARAVRVFAFSLPDTPIETNIRTVLVQHFFVGETHTADSVLREKLEEIMKCTRLSVRDLYYALMDYGAYLKRTGVSHNATNKSYRKQSAFKGSQRELRAKALFAIIHNESLPTDERLESVLRELEKENFIKQDCRSVTGWRVV